MNAEHVVERVAELIDGADDSAVIAVWQLREALNSEEPA